VSGDFRVTGADDLEKLAKRLKASGDKELRKELLRGIRETNKPTIAKIRESAAENLPRRGGLAAKVARETIGTRTRLTGPSAGVTIQRKRGRGLNEGRLRKPVFGNRKVWREQAVKKGWFDDPIEADAPRIREGLQKVMRDVATKITRGL
jgi:hypothetical protein